MKKRLNFILAICLTVASFFIFSNKADAAREYANDWRSYGTGTANGFNNGTSYRGWCFAHAYTKILIQSGARGTNYNPNNFKWDLNNYLGKTVKSNGYVTMNPSELARISNGRISDFRVDNLSGKSDEVKYGLIMNYVREGRQIMVTVTNGTHAFAVNNEASLRYNFPWIMDSITTQYDNHRMNYSLVSIDERNYPGRINQIFSWATTGTSPTPPIAQTLEDYGAVSVENISTTQATIKYTLNNLTNLSNFGFWIGKSEDDMELHREDVPTPKVRYIFYTLGNGKWIGSLEPGTTYYYKFYVTINGKYMESKVYNFKTAHAAPTIANIKLSSTSALVGEKISISGSSNNNATDYTLIVMDSNKNIIENLYSSNGIFYKNFSTPGKYFFKLMASNSAGSVSSDEVSLQVDELVYRIYFISKQTSIRDANNNEFVSTVKLGRGIKGYLLNDKIYFTLNGRKVYVYSSDVVYKKPSYVYVKSKAPVKDSDMKNVDYASRGTCINAVRIGDYYRYSINNQVRLIHYSYIQSEPIKLNFYVASEKISLRRNSDNSYLTTKKFGDYIYGYRRGGNIITSYNNVTAKLPAKNLVNRNPKNMYVKHLSSVKSNDYKVVGKKLKGAVINCVRIGNYCRYYQNGVRLIDYANVSSSPVNALVFLNYDSIVRRVSDGKILGQLKIGTSLSGIIKGENFHFTYKSQKCYVKLDMVRHLLPSTHTVLKTATVYNQKMDAVGKKAAGSKISAVRLGSYYRYYDNGVKFIKHTYVK